MVVDGASYKVYKLSENGEYKISHALLARLSSHLISSVDMYSCTRATRFLRITRNRGSYSIVGGEPKAAQRSFEAEKNWSNITIYQNIRLK